MQRGLSGTRHPAPSTQHPPFMPHYDDVIIGAGQGGVPLAEALAQRGRRVAVVERGAVGGTCVNRGCTPTKTLVASARVAHLVRRSADYGVRVGPPMVDLARVRERVHDVVREFRESVERRLTTTDGLTLVRGEARFTGARALAVRLADGGEERLTAERVVIDAGGRPRRPELEGLDELDAERVLDSASVLDLDSTPSHLLVVGGGYVALEYAQAFRRFGSAVTIVSHGDRLAAHEEPAVSEAVLDLLRREGITVHLNAEPRRVEPERKGLALHWRTADGEQQRAHGSHLLLAVGRVPNTDALDAARGGVELDERGHVRVNARLETSAEGVWAIGDVTGGPEFTHVSYDDHRILRANLLDGGDRSRDDRTLCWTTYTDPQIGHVGLTTAQARERGHRVRTATMPAAHVARAVETGEPHGLLHAVVDADTDQVLGFTAVVTEGGELMSAVQLAMLGGVTAAELRETMFAHPTWAEALNTLLRRL